MLELKNIKKDYPAGGKPVHALKGVSLQFRQSEFVAILGPSGCGKTTLLNIVGGLDQYSKGDLIINGRSTRDYKDRDWDSYRNHSVGFVFQSYNLIPHQTVLQNVELALSLSGVPKWERKKRAMSALIEVGLGDQLRKKPAEMSGGQMQRVAIARALVNDPDIILADEPTGALDTETSVQVMEILKRISAKRLVVMVTHNPDLAQTYSTRIIRMLDGEILSDSAPLSAEELEEAEKAVQAEKPKKKRAGREKKPSMSFGTSFGLSLKNLLSKRGRTALTSFAGSIGIIGIALIYAVSQGMTTYIDNVQEDTLSSYPLTLEAESMDMASIMMAFMDSASSQGGHHLNAVYPKGMLYDMLNAVGSTNTNKNDLAAFKKHLEREMEKTGEGSLTESLNGIQYTYNNPLLIYTKNVDGTIMASDSQALMQELMTEYMGMDISGMMNYGEDVMGSSTMSAMSSMSPMGSAMNLWQEILPGKDGSPVNQLLYSQYDVVYGSWPNSYNEVVLVVDERNEVDDMTLYALGLIPKEEVDLLAEAALNQTTVEPVRHRWTYEEICAMDFRLVLKADCYVTEDSSGLYSDLRVTEAGLKYLYDNGEPLRVTGIIRPREDATATMLSGAIAYTHELTEYIVRQSEDAPVILAQQESPTRDVLTGLPFGENTGNLSQQEKADEFCAYVNGLTEPEKAEVYITVMMVPTAEELSGMVAGAMEGVTIEQIRATMLQGISQQTGMDQEKLQEYLDSMSDAELEEMYLQMVEEQMRLQYGEHARAQLTAIPLEQRAAALDQTVPGYSTERLADLYDRVLEFSPSTLEDNLKAMGYVDLNSPSTINLYASSFEGKEAVENAIAAYNDTVGELEEITYTDYVGLMMSSVTTIINAITWVLIAFVAISLVVSSIMIGVITLISVQERTKEIGILRAIGASKGNVSRMFNAETMLIGLASGLVGVGITYLLCIPINALLDALTGISGLRAYLPLPVAAVLVGISILLTLFSGIIPSRSAAKKDPVVALRSE